MVLEAVVLLQDSQHETYCRSSRCASLLRSIPLLHPLLYSLVRRAASNGSNIFIAEVACYHLPGHTKQGCSLTGQGCIDNDFAGIDVDPARRFEKFETGRSF